MNFTVIQIFLAIAMIFLLFKTADRFRKRKIGFLWFAFWSAIWLCVIIMVFIPDTIGPVSKLIDIRPMSLAVDLSLIALFYLMFLMDIKISQMRSDIEKMNEFFEKKNKK